MRPAAAAGSGPHKCLFHREAAGNGPPRQQGSGGFAGQACVTGHVAPCPDTSRHQHPPSTLPVLPRRTLYLWIFLRLRGQKHTVISGKEAKMSHTVQCLLLGKGAARPRGLERGRRRDTGGTPGRAGAGEAQGMGLGPGCGSTALSRAQEVTRGGGCSPSPMAWARLHPSPVGLGLVRSSGLIQAPPALSPAWTVGSSHPGTTRPPPVCTLAVTPPVPSPTHPSCKTPASCCPWPR